MAKYDIRMSCGHEDTVELFGKTADRNRKIAWYEREGLCKACYQKQRREQEQQEGLVFNAAFTGYVKPDTGTVQLYAWFSGDTIPHRDEIKALGGYRWDVNVITSGFKPVHNWIKVITLDELGSEVKRAASIGATSAVPTNLRKLPNYRMAQEALREWRETNTEVSKIQRPTVPAILSGHKWNEKIYGKAGNRSIYLDGDKVLITDEQAEAVRSYLAAIDKYWRQVDAIKKNK